MKSLNAKKRIQVHSSAEAQYQAVKTFKYCLYEHAYIDVKSDYAPPHFLTDSAPAEYVHCVLRTAAFRNDATLVYLTLLAEEQVAPCRHLKIMAENGE
ncbi:hypothetical protein ACU60T_24125 [Klebsiella aerogenes]